MDKSVDHHEFRTHPHERIAGLFRALGDASRLSLIHCLSDGEHRVGELAEELGLAQSTVSQHLAVLRDAGLVQVRAMGRASVYRLVAPGVDSLLHQAEDMVAHPAKDMVAHQAEDMVADPDEDMVARGQAAQ